MKKTYKLNDGVWNRVVQIVQEAMLLGVDCADLLRQVEVEPNDDGQLSLTPEYEKMVKNHHEKLLDEADKLAQNKSSKLIIGDS
jgi:hypothetical protein